MLLKNAGNVLPFQRGLKVAVVGPHAVSQQGLLEDYYGDEVGACVCASCVKTRSPLPPSPTPPLQEFPLHALLTILVGLRPDSMLKLYCCIACTTLRVENGGCVCIRQGAYVKCVWCAYAHEFSLIPIATMPVSCRCASTRTTLALVVGCPACIETTPSTAS